ncbi:restriction endonuclease subunit S [Bacteroides fragilis]|uniref:restriction endonuclease subunit S n=1 Tax=Bacteroides fragilis TaxID=817 RepID=UPI00202EEBFA|nr:restriction endonuclease subunit S [Bacteroides fragilis]MCM0195698.1 restriction endonuclease subunit S [Bacteroides fragilis]MCM0201829.1 restriction endonuclease subunit S [Bacteroides fragilis]MCM0212309.1 restriction endonuclease subunit S [Bacteroides fragilis]MCM0242505.1 restriction endonuclease subunit S [Bacteroides fragilis]MCM0284157.1 restriction endonuclease subunit S [Bacteroides fragilis]
MRFPEFSGEWKKCKFGDIATGFDYGMNAAAKPFDGENKYIRITDIDEASSTYNDKDIVSPDGRLTDNYVVNDRDILLVRTGASTGKSYLYRKSDGKLYYAGFLIRANITEHNPYFVFSQLHTHRYWRWVSIMSARSGQPGINSQEYSSFPIFTTSLHEENKISTLLSLLNERIVTQNKIIEDLKKLKSAIAETLFCTPKESMPAKRVSTYSKEWKLIKLSDICQRIQTKNTGNQCRQVLTIAAQHGLVNQEDFFNKTVASENLEGYYLLQKGDFAYNKSYSGDYTWGAIKRLERYDKGVLSPLYICFRPDLSKVDADFLAHYFESKKWYKGVADIAGEGARNHGLLNISVIDFFNTTHRIPNLDEQKRIAKILNSLSLKLSCEQRIMQSLMMQRNYLLRNMFI